MTAKRLHLASVAALLVAGCAPGPAADAPASWSLTGSAPNDYLVARGGSSGSRTLRLAARTGTPSGFGTVAQVVDATPYRGQRVRVRATVDAEKVAGRAGVWFRVDGSDAILAFDNMEDRAISGTVSAQPVAVVLDVPAQAQRLAYGLLLRGGGEVSAGAIRVESVGADVQVTDQLSRPLPTRQPPVQNVLPAPANLDFER